MTQEIIGWNGEFGKKCNLPIDCVHCDIIECPGRPEEKIVIEGKHPVYRPNCFGAPDALCVKVCFLEPMRANTCLRRSVSSVQSNQKGEK